MKFGNYSIVTIDAVAGVFTHPRFSSPYVPGGLFLLQDNGDEGLGASMSGLYVDGSALGMPNGFLSCIGWSSDEDRTAWYSARFKNFSGGEWVETTANATLVCDTDARTITITHFENDGIDLTQYIPFASFKLCVLTPSFFA